MLTEAVLRRDAVQTVVARGHVEAPHRLDVASQITGTVPRVPVAEGRGVEAGDVVHPGTLLMTFSPRGSADANPRLRYAAELGDINPGVNATTGAVEVKLDAAAPPAVLKQDMTVSVDIEVAHRPKAAMRCAARCSSACAAVA